MSIARKMIGPRLAAGLLKPRPGWQGAAAPRPEPHIPGPMESQGAVQRVGELVHLGMSFREAWQIVRGEVEAEVIRDDEEEDV
jgi:uncharacterized protein YoaH (UPF0181 family)